MGIPGDAQVLLPSLHLGLIPGCSEEGGPCGMLGIDPGLAAGKSSALLAVLFALAPGAGLFLNLRFHRIAYFWVIYTIRLTKQVSTCHLDNTSSC